MSKQFERLRARLLCAGVAPRYVGRYLAELNEHLADVTYALEREGLGCRDAEATALVRMGSIDDLADAMIARRELRSWGARLPWAAFLVGPLLALIVASAAGLALLVLVIQLHRPDATAPVILPGWFGMLRTAVFGIDLYVLPIMLGWAVIATSLRQRIAIFWPVLGLAAVALVGGAVEFDLMVPTAPGMHGEVSVGLGLMPPFSGLSNSIFRVLMNLLLTVPAYLFLRERVRLAARQAVV